MEEATYIFYADNSSDGGLYHKRAYTVIGSMGFIPLIYRAITAAHGESNIDFEIREDLYKSDVVVLLFGAGEGWRDFTTHWILPELGHAKLAGKEILVYLAEAIEGIDVEEIDRSDVRGTVGDEASFAALLEEDLRRRH